ncbi:MAG: hypothetical protein QCI82_06210 [Candidatus Thermoplasmatota archaeon]|nr:hypothetical protein [Candidatus Thermoplasmatota archaeon]
MDRSKFSSDRGSIRRYNMRKVILVSGLMLIMLAASFMVLGDANKKIDNSSFTMSTPGGLVNVSTAEVNFEDTLFNNSANLFVYNNATYDMVKMKLTAGPSRDGIYPSNVRVDLDNNGRPEYVFGGAGTGQWGNQTLMFDRNYAVRSQIDFLPSAEGDLMYLKLPSSADVKSIEFEIEHPTEAVYKNILVNQNLPGVYMDYGYMYFYDYGYSAGGGYSYGYMYYYMNYFKYIQTSYLMSSNHMGYNYVPSSYYSHYIYGNPFYNYYIRWDETNQDLVVPPGANLMEYTMVWPVRQYRYSNSNYGYSWTNDSKPNYYAGERTYGLYEVTGDWPEYGDAGDYSYKYQSGDRWYAYNRQYVNPYSNASRDSYMDDLLPPSNNTPFSTYKVDENWGTSTYNDITDMSFDLYPIVRDWIDGVKDNNGLYINTYKTPYSTYPHWGGNYCLYNNNYPSSGFSAKRDRNNGYFYYHGQFINPLYSSNSGWDYMKPRLVLGFSLDSMNPWVDVGDDGVQDYSHPGKLEGSMSLSGYQAPINNYLRSNFPDMVDDYGNEWTYVPIRIGADSAGKVIVKNMTVKYDYEADLYYNPSKGNLLNELNSVVPKTEEGHTILNINVTSNTKGKVMFKDLEMTGMRPNYRPKLIEEIPDIEVDEGVENDMFLAISDHFMDEEQGSNTLQYYVKKNSMPGKVDIFFTTAAARADKVYMGISTANDPNWFGDVVVQIAALDEGGKETLTNEFTITILPVNDEPELVKELPVISAMEGIDDIQIEYIAPSGRDTANGKWSAIFHGRGTDYFMDVEGERIFLDFALLGPEMDEQTLITTDPNGFRYYAGERNQVTLTVLPPEYTDDPDNYVVLIGSHSDYSSDQGMYYLAIYASDNADEINTQSMFVLPINIVPVNDAPYVIDIPDIRMREDEIYVSNFNFVESYIFDVDTPREELLVTLRSRDEKVDVLLEDQKLHIIPEENYNGIVYVDVEVFDGELTTESSFRVLIESINDKPTLVVTNLYDGMMIEDILFIRGTADDVEKNLRNVQIGIVESGETVSASDWIVVKGTYVWNYILDIRLFDDGEYDIHIRAYDGNRDFSDVFSVGVAIKNPKQVLDLTPPIVTITTTFTSEMSDTVDIDGTVFDDSGYIELVEYRIDSGIWKKATVEGMSSWSARINTRMLENEEHIFSVRAYDGKAYSDTKTMNFDVYNEDSDMDGIPNDVEKTYGLDPFNPLDGAMDYDGDGFSNAVEIMGGYNPFDARSRPKAPGDDRTRLDAWAIIMIVVAVVFAVIIIGLFIMNVRMDRKIHKWREELQSRRMQRKPKTLLQKIVEIAPTYKPNVVPITGNALPGSATPSQENLPPAPEDLNQ